MDQSLSRFLGVLTSSKVLSTLAGVVIGGVIFLLVAWATGIFNPPSGTEEATELPAQLSKEKNAEFLASHAKVAGVTVTKSGLQYRVIKAGTGKKPESARSIVKVQYTGKFIDGSTFDSSVGGPPVEFGLNQVIPGWTEGLQLMHEGEKAELVIPYQLGYGPEGHGAAIPPYQTLVFEVELLSVK
jgi:FKBP-type peptidyl-prolyl cis-trans isomerase FkpA